MSADGTTRIPPAVREAVELTEGDRLRWPVDEAGTVTVAVLGERKGLADLEPVELDERTNAAEDHDEILD